MHKFTFARKLSDFLNTKCSKRNVSSGKVTDKQLNEEFEAFLRELECLTGKRSLLLSFKNDNFDGAASSKDLSKRSESRSSELVTGRSKHLTESDLLAYLTHIIIRPNCNKACKSVFKEISTARQEDQFEEDGFNPFSVTVQNSFTQTDDYVLRHTCVYCSKQGLRAQLNSTRECKDVATSDRLLKTDEQTSTVRDSRSVTTGLSNKGFADASTSYKLQRPSRTSIAGGEKTSAKMCLPNNCAALQQKVKASVNASTSINDLEGDQMTLKNIKEEGKTDDKEATSSDSSRNKRNRTRKKGTDSSSDKFDDDDDERTSKCFSRRKKQPKYLRKGNSVQRSMQTIPVETENRSEQFDGQKDRQTSTDSDVPYVGEKRPTSGWVCRKCGKEKRDCTGCRNTIVMPARDSESLMFIIKMQSKNNERRFDNIMNQLNHQGNEIRRLNEMYRGMIEKHYAARLCSCAKDGRLDCDENRRGKYGPPSPAVAIHMCDTCNVDVGGTLLARSLSRDSCGSGEKRFKDIFNHSTKSKEPLSRVSEHVNGCGSEANTSILTEIIAKDSPEVHMGNHNMGHQTHSTYGARILGWLKTSWDKTRRNLEQCKRRSQEATETDAGLVKLKRWVTAFVRTGGKSK
ncbi:uncharacterized protein LOC132703608 isoform X2 [Cylas formicarius]|uniref:uncharacterized protein LOC132703608 isoform X2 n=1 Tax=Cylas formicarius TaxID=197179 RepID=UPI0029589A16|nr:uncharacterized protein LOC132703608 isoform X2 [Cylas formicarius]